MHGGFEFQAQKEHLDLGNVLVGDLQSCSVVLLNDGICSLKYILSVEQLITGPCDPEEFCSDPLGTVRDVAWGGGLGFPLFSANSIQHELGGWAGYWLACLDSKCLKGSAPLLRDLLQVTLLSYWKKHNPEPEN